jgi:hypothetical protein
LTSLDERGDKPSRRPSIYDGPGWQLFAYSLWVIGCVLFALVAVDSRDWRSFAASLLFLVGVLAVMIPLERERRSR